MSLPKFLEFDSIQLLYKDPHLKKVLIRIKDIVAITDEGTWSYDSAMYKVCHLLLRTSGLNVVACYSDLKRKLYD